MELYSFVVAFFRDGGVFLYPMAAVFVAGVAIAIERYFVLTKTSLVNRQVWEKITPSMKVGNFQEAMKIAEKSNSALGTVLCYGLSRARVTYRRDDIEKAMEESLLEIIPRLDKRTHYLSSLANIGMLMGLLGTVVGLISAFGAISTANPADKASLLAASISVAMNNTAGGLIVAIMWDQGDGEDVFRERGDGEGDAVHRDRALLDAVAQDLERRLDGSPSPPPSGSSERTRPTPSTWPWTMWPPSGSPARSAGSRLTSLPGSSRPSEVRRSVSATASKATTPSSTAVAVRQTPLIAIESPTAVRAAVCAASIRRRTPSAPPSTAATRPRSLTIPVNTRRRLLAE